MFSMLYYTLDFTKVAGTFMFFVMKLEFGCGSPAVRNNFSAEVKLKLFIQYFYYRKELRLSPRQLRKIKMATMLKL